MEVKTKYQNATLACLVPKEGKGGLTSHEKTLCDCEVIELIDKLEAQNKELVEALEKWQGYSDGVVLDGEGCCLTEKDIYDHVEEVLAKIKSEER